MTTQLELDHRTKDGPRSLFCTLRCDPASHCPTLAERMRAWWTVAMCGDKPCPPRFPHTYLMQQSHHLHAVQLLSLDITTLRLLQS